MTAQVIPLPRTSQETTRKTLRELRLERGWSMAKTARALRACATEQERKGLPGPESLLQNWVRWETGKVEPDRGRPAFYKPIIARAFGMTPEQIWLPAAPATTPLTAGVTELRTTLLARRDQLARELAYLNAVLAIPAPDPA